MSIKIILGTQWGDEGKGKFVDYFSAKCDVVARYNGSGGAAHTVNNQYGTFKLHLLPCGIFSPKTTVLIANGVVVEPELLLKEISEVEKAGLKLKGRLFISPRCHLVFPYHKILDGLTNAVYAKNKTSPTTGRGNGPVNADKISYHGIRLYDLINKDQFSQKLLIAVKINNKIISSLKVDLGVKPPRYQDILELYLGYAEKLKPFIKETLPILEKSLEANKHVLFEGVNGFFLDNDWGAYPYVTTASILPTEVTRGCGINPYLYNHEVIGIAKAYMTRVDNGECPLPSEWPENVQTKSFRDKNNEYGSGTGRPRRICWFDTEVVKFAHRLSRYDYLCLTRLDSLSGMKKIKICVSYTFQGKKADYLDGDAEFYRQVKPVYEEMEGWSEDISLCRNYRDLPLNVRKYLERLETKCQIPIKYISVGPNREQTIKRLSGKRIK